MSSSLYESLQKIFCIEPEENKSEENKSEENRIRVKCWNSKAHEPDDKRTLNPNSTFIHYLENDGDSVAEERVVYCPFCNKPNIIPEKEIIAHKKDRSKIIEAEPIKSPMKIRWINYNQKLAEGSFDALSSHSKSMIALFTTIVGSYATIIAFFGIFGDAFSIINITWIDAFFLLLAPILWLCGVIFYILSSCPEEKRPIGDSPDNIRKVVEGHLRKKDCLQTRGDVFFILGFVALIIVFIMAHPIVDRLSEPQPARIKFYVSNESKPFFSSMNISFDPADSMLTQELVLISDTDNRYKIQTSSNNIIQFDQSYVKYVIFIVQTAPIENI
jgi:hypothetical protein